MRSSNNFPMLFDNLNKYENECSYIMSHTIASILTLTFFIVLLQGGDIADYAGCTAYFLLKLFFSTLNYKILSITHHL